MIRVFRLPNKLPLVLSLRLFSSTRPKTVDKTLVRIDVAIDPLKVKRNVFCDEVVTVLEKVRPAWFKEDQYRQSTLKTKVLTEGLTNMLYLYHQEGKFKEDAVVVRVHGIGTEKFMDREQEIKNIKALSAAGMSFPVYAVFKNGIAYGFVHGNTLDLKDLKDEKIRKLIAEEMVKYHSVQPEGPKTTTKFLDIISSLLEMSPDRFEDPDMQTRFVANIKPKAVLRKEFQELREHLESLNSPVVFCHNDLLPKNIVYNEERGRVHFIDHEFAMYNYEHYELGDHFCEYAGVPPDFSLYPDKAYQMDWLRYYLHQKAIKNGENPDTVTDRDVEICYIKANKFSLAVHMLCGLFGLIQAKNSSIEFGYFKYAELHLAEYFTRKDEFLAMKLPG